MKNFKQIKLEKEFHIVDPLSNLSKVLQKIFFHLATPSLLHPTQFLYL